ncbi:MAG: nitroreductase family protein [Bacteroidales bacterium]
MKTIEALLNRKSDRDFTGEHINEEDLELIIRAALQSPTSMGAQQISLIVIDDKKEISKIAKICGGQPQVSAADKFILVIMDFNRTKLAVELGGKNQIIQDSLEGLMVGAVDAGIIIGTLEAAIRYLGYGSTVIGAIRNDPKGIINMFNLPKYTFPLVGITMGVIDKNKEALVKPRIPIESFAFRGKYKQEKVTEGIQIYNQKMRNWWDRQGLQTMPDYYSSLAEIYSAPYIQEYYDVLKTQGFDFELTQERKNVTIQS